MGDRPRSFLGRVFGSLLACLVVGGLAGCDGGDGGQQEEKGFTLTVLAASSLTDAFGELESTFEEQNQGIEVTTSFASSSDLLTQIQQGAPGDIFGSADEAKMETAVEEGLVDGPTIFARNSPVVIVPANNPAGIQDFQDLAQVQAQLVLAEDGVPIADYAEDVLANADSQYGAGFGQTVLDKVVSREANVRASANRVALGEADATFVYTSDVTEDIRHQVQVIEIPENVNVMATYPIATIAESQHPELAQEWIDLVLSDEGQRVLEEYGFQPVS
jgi:molybdate transport system substrate-binding protein